MIEQLEKYRKEASDEYSSDGEYREEHNEILDEALEEEIDRDINNQDEE